MSLQAAVCPVVSVLAKYSQSPGFDLNRGRKYTRLERCTISSTLTIPSGNHCTNVILGHFVSTMIFSPLVAQQLSNNGITVSIVERCP
jgi:hypothetical protein